MSAGQTVVLNNAHARDTARRLVDHAPPGAIVNIREANRTSGQNALMWALLSDVSRAKPDDRTHTADMWKNLFMHACGHAVQFENGLDGQPFPVGFRSSRLTKAQMTELIEFILSWGTQNGVQFSANRP